MNNTLGKNGNENMHSYTLKTMEGTYNYYVRCMDSSKNISNASLITFSIQKILS